MITQSLANPRPRLLWNDLDWATYLDCPVQKIPEYKRILSENFVVRIHLCSANNRYIFELFQKVMGPKGRKQMRYVYSDWYYQFCDRAQEIQVANEYISNMVFRDEVATKLNLPKKSFQMMLIREK